MAGIYRRGATYWARAQRKGVEHRCSLGTSDRQVAKRRFEQWLENLEATAWGERPRVTFAQAVKQFIEQHFDTLKPRSALRYGNSLKKLSIRFGDKYLTDIDKAMLADFETMRRSEGVSPSSIRRDFACLSSLISFCEDKDWVEEGFNPVKGYLRKRAKRGLKEGQPRTRYFSHAEEEAMLKLAKLPLREAIMLAIDTGLREQELFSLTWPQIDLLNCTIRTTKDTKNGRARSVPVPERSAQFLAQWKAKNTGPVASLYVFHKSRGQRFKNFYRSFKTLTRRLGFGEVQWHDLRRTAGCRWLQDYGKSLHEVSVLLGHSSYAVTERSYAFLDQHRIATETAQFPAQLRAEKAASNEKD